MKPRRLPPGLPRLPSVGKRLTWREVRIVELVAAGLSNAEIGARLYLSPDTVKARLTRIRIKLAAANRAAIVNRAWQQGYLKPGGDDQ